MLHGASEGSHAPGVVALGLIDGVSDIASLLILIKVSLFQIGRGHGERVRYKDTC